MTKQPEFHVIIVGAGHAGIEAALAVARLQLRVLVVTLRRSAVGQLSCNPAIGGVGKSHLVREIDALGGAMAAAADATGIQFRVLNASRGAAVRATRIQVDAVEYPQYMARQLQRHSNLTLLEDEVVDLLRNQAGILGVQTAKHGFIASQAVVCTSGTFLRGQCFVGQERFAGGRLGDVGAVALSAALQKMGLQLGRFKTGTTPRLCADSIDWDVLEAQDSDHPLPCLAFDALPGPLPRRLCHITYTNPQTHALIAAGLQDSPLYGGDIVGRGPRYCPSIEDKVVRFADKERHHVFLEPESNHNQRVYANGLATSLPKALQLAFLRTMPGLGQVEVEDYGYAVEYDYADPRQLCLGLMSRACPGLFLAGQINGTSGYEEAAAQGLWAGLNAARYVQGMPFAEISQQQAYLGVLLHDLVEGGVDEPYRMFTARSAYRLSLRESNAEARLLPLGQAWGLVDAARAHCAEIRHQERQRLRAFLAQSSLRPLAALGWVLGSATSVSDLLRRPEISMQAVLTQLQAPAFSQAAQLAVEEEIKYHGYIQRERKDMARLQQLQGRLFPPSFDFRQVPGLSSELRERLHRRQPRSLSEASAIPGMTPAGLSVLSVVTHIAG